LQNLHPIGRQPDASFIQLADSRMQTSSSWPPARCKFHSVGCQPDANFIQSATSRMQYASGLRPCNTKYPNLSMWHVAGDQPNEICIWLAASRMQILQK
jgi:hypothetical protein